MAFFRIKKGIGGYMAHQAIYRKWRPMVFEDELVGREWFGIYLPGNT